MDTSYYKSKEPFWGKWHIDHLIGEGAYGKVFEIRREDFGITYSSAMKVITIPQSESEWKSTLSEGMDENSATEFYEGVVNGFISEIQLMNLLKGNSNIVSYEDHDVLKHENGHGWDILVRMELLQPMVETIPQDDSLPLGTVIKLAKDICNALELCEKNHLIHRDLKPENIFISRNGDYKLGDFGIARKIEQSTGAFSKKGTYTYMAPEVYKGHDYDSTVDIYSLGIVMYRLTNKNRAPFLPAYPNPIRYNDREESLIRRIKGEEIPSPVDAGDELGRIILKACAYRPEDRYQTAAELREALENVEIPAEEIHGASSFAEEIIQAQEESIKNSVEDGLPALDEQLVQKSESEPGEKTHGVFDSLANLKKKDSNLEPESEAIKETETKAESEHPVETREDEESEPPKSQKVKKLKKEKRHGKSMTPEPEVPLRDAEAAAEQMKIWYQVVFWGVLLLSLIGHVLKTLVMVAYMPLLSILAVGMLAYCIVTLVAWRKRKKSAVLLFRIYLIVNFVCALGFLLLFYAIPAVLPGTLFLSVIPFGFYLVINKKKLPAERAFFIN